MDKEIQSAIESSKQFYNESKRFLEVCEKPNATGIQILN
jgi:preprotein translocase subunit Sss1